MDAQASDQALRKRAQSNAKGTEWGADDPQKMLIQDILYEFMYSGDVEEAVSVIKQKKNIEGVELTKRALIFGIERQPYERELVSLLLSQAYNIFGGSEIKDGFQLMLYRLPDLVLDVPDAPAILAKFISRGIYDEILPPAFMKDAIVDNQHAKETMSLAFATTHSTDEQRRLEHIWGPGDMASVESLKLAVDNILIEYLANPDIAVATQTVKELNVPSFAGQIVKRALVKAIEHNTDVSRDSIINLFESWHKTNLISDGCLKRGFGAAWKQIDDISLDVPVAPKVINELQALAIKRKLLPADFKPVLESQ
jgi:programmed cell death protein 4